MWNFLYRFQKTIEWGFPVNIFRKIRIGIPKKILTDNPYRTSGLDRQSLPVRKYSLGFFSPSIFLRFFCIGIPKEIKTSGKINRPEP